MTSPRLQSRLNYYAPTMISVFRIVIGLLFAIHGSSKLFGWPFPGPQMAFLEWPGWWAGLIELVTGVLVTIGLFTRPAAFVAAGQMAVAYFWQHVADPPPTVTPSFWPHLNGGELAVIYCFAFLLLFFVGPGSFAVETMRRQRVVTGTAAPPGTGGGLLRRRGPAVDGAPARRPGLLSRFRR